MYGKLTVTRRAAVALMAAVVSLACGAQQATNTPTASDVGITKDTITLGGTYPLSGPAAAHADIPKSLNAYFQYTNPNRGVNGRNITFTVGNRGYNPAHTPAKARAPVPADQGVSTPGNPGTPPNLP